MQKTNYELNWMIGSLKSVLSIANSHMVHFITHNMFNKYLLQTIQEEIMTLSVNELNSIVLKNCNKQVHDKAPNLSEFLNRIQRLSLKVNDTCLPLEKLFENFGSNSFTENSFEITKHLLSVKKSHEVERMSCVIAALAKSKNCTHIVDVGGGKGYLSSILALKYNLKVLSVDSSHITCKGAEKQIPKFEKLWKTFQKKSSKPDNTNITTNQRSHSKMEQESSEMCKLATLYITEDTNVIDLLKEQFPGDIFGGIMLVGLHTCGNLAASSLRLFIKNPHYIKCLVNIGCCYNLIVEEFDTLHHGLEVERQASGIGFPMSFYLRDKGFVLGRNARMLAAQPLERVSHVGVLNTENLFYRALLESYLEKKLCNEKGLPPFRVGRLARKCSSFIEYVHESIKRLNLNIEVDDGEVQKLYKSHSDTKKQLHAYFLLRLAVAPAIEAVIMLDRLLYLQEQGIEDAYLSQVFDPVVSPRSFAIIACNKS